ncbi:NAD(P)/FAD-dependent oxidoreductase [Romboutsia ilealis]|uniref:NAD(P)/FAD-dependent oxidoreductase n=1 Tax=Romboutsia faecis TaxID=2764597 RepID=A0ABR7JSJ3_9FIRM|nr:NAD(P)/FAD-dependent oxidoreductase [Romboutsia faecis]MBC5997844.1 NAD(P)/FAD-dependent oxidoreductase [Romboutsia faecis]MRN25543.1 NAD(P)/FAD-dependent oxidoreductase [Romboutsia ilealis]
MINKFDAIIIGFGKGGKTLATDLANRGQKVALIEKSPNMYGGTCINKACIPTKILENEASIIRRENLNNFEDMKARYKKSIIRKDELITKLRIANYNKLNNNENIIIFTGQGSFINEKIVEVNTIDGERIILEGDKVFINTGSKPSIPDIKGVDNLNIVYTSETLMNLKELPKKITIVGAGFIGLEFAGIYSSFGSEVTVVNTHKTILMKEDEEDSTEIINILEKRNVSFISDVSIKEIKEENKLAKLIYTRYGEEEELVSDIILMATGRKANLDGLKVENARIELDSRGFIKVDDTLKTNVENIWALGDINGGPQFTYISLDDYRIIVNQLFGDKTRKTTDRKNIPSVLFIDPAFSRVGLNVKEAKVKGYNVLVAKMSTEVIPRAKQLGKTDGFIKIVIDKDSEKILGATMIAEGSSEIIHLIQLAIDLGVKYTYLRDRIYAHPTMTESLNEILSDAMIKEV